MRRRGIFKSFFGCQDPQLLLPSKKKTKLQDWPIFQASISIIQVNVGSWRKISFDEATRDFKGKHSLKYVIKFKKEGNGYLLDCIGDGGFIYNFTSEQLQRQRNGWIKGSIPHKQDFSFCLSSPHVSFTYAIWRVPDQDFPLFHSPSHLSELWSFKSIISTHVHFIFIFK